MSLSGKMGAVHERWLVSVFGGRKTKASGSQWADQMDGRHNRRDVPFAFAWDGKSTLAKSISVTRKMWAKAREQAGGERPLLALRFYDTEALDVGEDLVVLSANDFIEMLDEANRTEPVRIFVSTRSNEEEEDFLHLGRPIKASPYAQSQPLVLVDGKVTRPDWISLICRQGQPYSITATTNGIETDFPGRQVDLYMDNVLRASTGLMEEMPKRSMGKLW